MNNDVSIRIQKLSKQNCLKDLSNKKKKRTLVVVMVSDVIDYEFELTLGYRNCNDLRPVIVKDVINVILVRKDLSNVILTTDLIKYPIQKFKLNLTIYFSYNFVIISLTTGLLCDNAISFVLAPVLSAIGWITRCSLAIEISLFIKEFKLKIQ